MKAQAETVCKPAADGLELSDSPTVVFPRILVFLVASCKNLTTGTTKYTNGPGRELRRFCPYSFIL